MAAHEVDIAAITLMIMKNHNRIMIIGRSCTNCATTESPVWRKDNNKKFLCNKCGVYLKTHGRMRPLTIDGLYWYRKRGATGGPLKSPPGNK